MRLVLAAAIAALSSTTIAAAEECLYSRDHYTVIPFVDWVTFDPTTLKTGILMRDGTPIAIRHYDCAVQGLSAHMIVEPPVRDDAAARERLAGLGDVVLPRQEQQDLAAAIDDDLVYDAETEIAGGPENRTAFSYAIHRMGGYDLFELHYQYD